MENLSGQSIKGYDLQERIGTGGFGAVYKAYQSTIGREVAVKIILPGYANNPDFIRRFEMEAQLIARLEHPFIVPLFDYWRDPDGAYLVMRWLRGGSLHDALQSEGMFKLESIAQALDQITAALSVAHRNNIIHRDIKPGNILLDEDQNVYLADFGIAKDLLQPKEGFTEPNAVVGSLDYISPEQARGLPVTPRTDIYSLGVVIYELLKGEHPFPDSNPLERLYKHINDELPVYQNGNKQVSDALNAVIQKATAKNPDHRFNDALELAAAFRQAAALDRPSVGENIVEQLTRREQDILRLIISGRTNQQIANELFIELSTVKWYINQLYKKLGVRTRMQAIVRARELDLVVDTGQWEQHASDAAVSVVSLPEPENPYKGLRAFEPADHRDFHGQEQLIERLLERMNENVKFARFLAIAGPSGSGKSSIVKAGLIPALWRGDLPESEKWFIAEVLPGTHPIDKLEVALMRVAANQADNLHEQLTRDDRGLTRIADLILPDDGSELVIIIDQFEEVFTLVEDEQERQHFLGLIRVAVTEPRSRVRVIVTLRADFYDRPLHYPEFGELVRSRMETVLPLGAKGLERAIVEPAKREGVVFEDGLVAQIVSEMTYQSGALPLLQYALTELFERRDGRLLTHEAYQELGGAAGALARRAEGLYTELSSDEQALVRQMFLRLVTLGEGAEDTRRRIPRHELVSIAGDQSTMMDEIIDTYSTYRLLTLDNDVTSRKPTVEVAHEAILREWDRLRDWLNNSRDDIKQERQIAHEAESWQANNKDKSYLRTGSKLEQAEQWQSVTELALTPLVSDFIQTSIKEAKAQEIAEKERLEREKQQEQRSRTLLRALVAVFAVAAILSGGFGVFALNQRDDARHSTNVSQSLLLATSAREAASNNDMDLALALALEANRIPDAPDQVLNTLSDLAFAPGTRRVFEGLNVPIWTVAVSPNGQYAVAAGGYFWRADDQGDVRLALWEVDSAEIVRYFEGHTATIVRLDFSPDGHFILSSSLDGTIRLWDVETGQEIRHFEGHTALAIAEFSPDGRFILSGSDDNTVRLWDVETGTEIRRFEGFNLPVNWEDGLAFGSNGRTALTGHWDGQMILWDIETGQEITRFESGEAPTIAISPDGQMAVSGLVDSTLRMWDIETGEEVRRFVGGHTDFVTEVEFSPDGRTIASSGGDGFLVLWDVETGEVIQKFAGHKDGITNLVFSSDGRHIFTASVDSTLRQWDVDNSLIQHRLDGHQDVIWSVDISPDGLTAVSTSGRRDWAEPNLDNSVRIWDLTTGDEIGRFIGHQETVFTASISPDGKTVISGSGDAITGSSRNALLLWDLETGEIVRRFVGHRDFVYPVTFSADGYRAVSHDKFGVILWDVKTGQEIRRFARQWVDSSIEQGFYHALSPDGRILVITFSDGAVIAWDVETGVAMRHYGANGGGHQTYVRTVDFSPDGRLLLTGGDDENLILWDVETGRPIRRLQGHTGPIYSVTFGPDGRTALSGSTDASFIWWDVETGEIIRRFHVNDGAIRGLAFQKRADGSLIAVSVSEGLSLIVWNVFSQTRDELITWTYDNRFIRELTCNERKQYHIQSACDSDNLDSIGADNLSPTTIPDLLSPATATPTVEPVVAGQMAQIGENRGDFNVGGGEIWDYQGLAGEVVTIRVNADNPLVLDNDIHIPLEDGGMDTFLVIKHPDGSLLEINDDAFPDAFEDIQARTSNSGITNLELPVDGVYQIIVRSLSNDSGGAYTLIIESGVGGE